MNKMIAYCGIDCAKCLGYIATQSNDLESLERTAENWRKQFNSSDITAESVICDGCTNNGRLSGYCRMICKIRSCGLKNGVKNCAYCSDYDTCNILAAFHAHTTTAEAKATLDSLHSVM